MSGDARIWDLTWDGQLRRLRLVVEGHLEGEEGARAADRFREEAQGRNFEFVADLSGMTGYDRTAREAWQAALIDTRGSISTVHFVGLTPVFRMAAATVCLATRIRAHFYERDEAIPPTGPQGRD